MHLPMDLGRDGNSSTHLFGMGLKFVYLLMYLGRAWPFIHPFIWQGMATHLPMNLGGIWNLFIYLSIWKGKAINLPISLGGDNYLGGDGHASTHLFGKDLQFLYLFIYLLIY